MARCVLRFVAAGFVLLEISIIDPAVAQKTGGILRQYIIDSPASMSIHEETTVVAERPMMGVMNNLVIFDQHVKQNSLASIVPDLATDWTWDEDGTRLSFHLRQGVTWHDGKPFTAADVKCTWDLVQGKTAEKLRVNPRKVWYNNLAEVVTNGDYEAIFVLKRPQPAFLALLASGMSPVYPCHVTPAQMRQRPIGTGPFKFVDFKPNEYIKVARNPDYWKPGRPYLDGVEYTIVTNRSTAVLGFLAGRFDLTWPWSITAALMRDIKNQSPQANCEMRPNNGTNNLLLNRDKLTIDRKAFVDILTEGEGKIGAAMLPPPAGLWGMPPEMLQQVPGYDPDVAKNRAQARQIMQKLGYGPEKRLDLKVSARNVALFREPAVILIDQRKEIYIDATLETTETANWYPKVTRKDYAIAINNTGNGVDDPDQQFYENYACGSARNYSGYCNPELDKKFDEQSTMRDQEQRRKMVWEIDKRLQEDGARPIIYHLLGATCMQPRVKGLTMMVNSIFNGWRLEDTWLER